MNCFAKSATIYGFAAVVLFVCVPVAQADLVMTVDPVTKTLVITRSANGDMNNNSVAEWRNVGGGVTNTPSSTVSLGTPAAFSPNPFPPGANLRLDTVNNFIAVQLFDPASGSHLYMGTGIAIDYSGAFLADQLYFESQAVLGLTLTETMGPGTLGTIQLQVNNIPEPTSLLLLSIACMAGFAFRRR